MVGKEAKGAPKVQAGGKPAAEKPKAAKGKAGKGKKLKATLYSVSSGKLERKRKACPKCGAGVFLAEHRERLACGRCTYTEWKSGKQGDAK